jgi:uncharacterized protein
MHSWSLTGGTLAVCCLLSGCAWMGSLSPLAPVERSLIYHPVRHPDGSDWSPAGLDYEEAWFEATDGTRLHGWFASHPHPQAVALYLHGNAGNISYLADTLRLLSERHRLALMAFDYRGFGRSEGTPSEAGLYQDARAARAWLAKRTGVAEGDIVLIGYSLGGAVAVELAARDGARALVLNNTFSSAPDVGKTVLPWMAPHWNMTHRFDSISKIKNYQGPLLQCHGDQDRVIPIELGRKLFDAAPGPKRWVTTPGADHADPQNEEYHLALDELLASLAAPRIPR